ncbi:hypothetical protein EON81_09010 [bacterium]|nr:MAG: hypothetical protein EON81_09010 [bacterium]
MRRLAAFPLFLLAGCSANVALPLTAKRAYGDPVTVCEIQDARVKESSGLAPSLRHKGVWYTHNDSGDGPLFFAFNEKGKVLDSYRITGAKAEDWEDMSSAEVGGTNYLYFGDIGDNRGRRKEVTVYRVREPEGGGDVPLDKVITLRYPDGAHNAEALMVLPGSGEICVVTKTSEDKAGVYLAGPEGGEMRKIGGIDVGGFIRESRKVTGGTVSPDGKYVAVRTYMAAYEFPVSDRFEDWPKSKPLKIKTNLDLQGEGIAYSADGGSLWTSSEMVPSQISRIARVN